jgi:hypothetical protein
MSVIDQFDITVIACAFFAEHPKYPDAMTACIFHTVADECETE